MTVEPVGGGRDQKVPDAALRAGIVGTGLIGGSLGLALRARGWTVTGRDSNEARARRAVELGALDAVGTDPEARITFVCTPVLSLPSEVRAALASGPGVVTDVGSVKSPIVAEIDDPRFVGGHPMAGSEQDGIEGADAGLFGGTTWVLTPAVHTDPDAYTVVRSVVTSLGADVVPLAPDRHDEVVAVVSHVPHLVAATLMSLADSKDTSQAAGRRLAAGGFRDMTRVAAGHPGIWPDICAENREAIVAALDRLTERLAGMRKLVDGADRDGLLDVLRTARSARLELVSDLPRVGATDMAELRVPVLDRPGVLAEVTTLLGELDVNIEDLEIVHSAEGPRGVLVLVVAARAAETARAALVDRGYRPSIGLLS